MERRVRAWGLVVLILPVLSACAPPPPTESSERPLGTPLCASMEEVGTTRLLDPDPFITIGWDATGDGDWPHPVDFSWDYEGDCWPNGGFKLHLGIDADEFEAGRVSSWVRPGSELVARDPLRSPLVAACVPTRAGTGVRSCPLPAAGCRRPGLGQGLRRELAAGGKGRRTALLGSGRRARIRHPRLRSDDAPSRILAAVADEDAGRRRRNPGMHATRAAPQRTEDVHAGCLRPERAPGSLHVVGLNLSGETSPGLARRASCRWRPEPRVRARPVRRPRGQPSPDDRARPEPPDRLAPTAHRWGYEPGLPHQVPGGRRSPGSRPGR